VVGADAHEARRGLAGPQLWQVPADVQRDRGVGGQAPRRRQHHAVFAVAHGRHIDDAHADAQRLVVAATIVYQCPVASAGHRPIAVDRTAPGAAGGRTGTADLAGVGQAIIVVVAADEYLAAKRKTRAGLGVNAPRVGARGGIEQKQSLESTAVVEGIVGVVQVGREADRGRHDDRRAGGGEAGIAHRDQAGQVGHGAGIAGIGGQLDRGRDITGVGEYRQRQHEIRHRIRRGRSVAQAHAAVDPVAAGAIALHVDVDGERLLPARGQTEALRCHRQLGVIAGFGQHAVAAAVAVVGEGAGEIATAAAVGTVQGWAVQLPRVTAGRRAGRDECIGGNIQMERRAHRAGDAGAAGAAFDPVRRGHAIFQDNAG